jgi:uncharacterized LabA/DUF88 family protein
MDILVDYNNVPETARKKGPVFVVDKIIAALGSQHIGDSRRVSVRLYDGWYENRTPTRLAQRVATEVLANNPMTRTLSDGTTERTVLVNTELAYSLRSAPAQHLWHTFRQSIHAGNVKFRHPSTSGCNDPDCLLIAAHQFLLHKRCPRHECKLTPEALIQRSEQKLVDTMMAADLFSLYLQSLRQAVVVTSDDDLWPAIRLVLQLGVQVFHIHTMPGRRTPQFYSQYAGPGYTQLEL